MRQLPRLARRHASKDRSALTSSRKRSENGKRGAVLFARHKQATGQATDSIREAAEQVRRGNDEVAVTMLRAAIEALSQIEQQHIDEQVLDRIFSRFCIGK